MYSNSIFCTWYNRLLVASSLLPLTIYIFRPKVFDLYNFKFRSDEYVEEDTTYFTTFK